MTADNDKSKPTPTMADKTLDQTGGSTRNPESSTTASSLSTDASLNPIEKQAIGVSDQNGKLSGEGFVIEPQPTQDSPPTAESAEAKNQSRVAKDVSNKMDTAPTSSPKSDKQPASSADAGRQSSATARVNQSSTSVSNRSGAAGWVAGGAAVIAVILAAGLWWQNQRFEAVSREVATRLQATDQQVTQLTRDVQSALSNTSSQNEQMKLLQRDVRTMRSEMMSMDQAWQSVSRSLDDRLLVSYLRRLLNLSQQLVLTGQATGAISVLESAVDLIQRHHSPEQFVALASAIGSDLERLRAMPVVDVSELSMQLGRIVSLVEKAPLQVPDRVAPGLASIQSSATPVVHADAATVAEGGATTEVTGSAWWQQWLNTAEQTVSSVAKVASREFSDLMQVRRADTPQTLLLSEEQAMLVRTNLRSMLLGAQLALLNRQSTIWQAELTSVSDMLNTYYDAESTDVKAALTLLQSLRQSPIAIDVKPITESLSALAVVAQAVTVPAISGESH